jgi:hypothetical protein
MNIRDEIRQIESHVKQLAATKAEQIAMISKAQSMVTSDYQMAILMIVKRRILRQRKK